MEGKPSRTGELLRFFLFTFAFSRVLWIPVIVLRPQMEIAMPVVLLGAFAPTLLGIGLTRR